MLKRNKFLSAMIASTTLLTSASALAETSVTGTASVTVQNAFDVTETQALNFGTIGAQAGDTYDAAKAAALTVQADGGSTVDTVTDQLGKIIKITDGTNGIFDVTNAAPFTELTFTLPLDASPVELLNAAAPGDAGKFEVKKFTAYDLNENTAVTLATSVGTVNTTVDGAVQLGIGATLAIANAGKFYDGEFTGNFTIKVAY